MIANSSPFRNKIRIRVCGLLVESDEILLAQIHSPVVDELIWIPPGGAIQFGESMKEGLEREFSEETDLEIEVHDLLHINELISPPFHALECYFEVSKVGGELQLGTDPELPENQQMLKDLQWISLQKLDDLSFAPEELIEKLQNWQQRSSFTLFPTQ